MSERLLGEAQPLGLRLFLEGVEVPVVAATVDINEGAAAVAQIELVALDSAFQIKPRTVVHLFFLDGDDFKYGPRSTTQKSEFERKDKTDPFSAPAPPKTETSKRGVDDFYKLLFCGEVFSYSYQKSGTGSRSFILNCIDFSNYWDTSYIFQVSDTDSLLDVPAIQPFITGSDVFVPTVGGTESMVGMLISFLSSQSVLSQSVPPAPIEQSYLSRLMGFLELLGGVSVLDDDTAVSKEDKTAVAQRMSVHGGLNAWHTITERRVRLLDQIAVDEGRTASEAFKDDKLVEFLKGQADLSSSVLSFRDILNLLMGHIYYSSYPNPCARILTGIDTTVTALQPGATTTTPVGVASPPNYVPPNGYSVPPQFLPKTGNVEADRALFLDPKKIPKYEDKWAYEQLSANFTYADLTPGMQENKTLGTAYYNFLRDLCLYILEDAYEFLKVHYKLTKRFSINSGFRSPAQNKNAGPKASPTSYHMKGMAADCGFSATNLTAWDAYKILRLEWLPNKPADLVGEILFECSSPDSPGWVHIGLGTRWGGPKTREGVGVPESKEFMNTYGIPVLPWPILKRGDVRPTPANSDVIASANKALKARKDAKKGKK